MTVRIITWCLFYACTLVAAAGAFWFVGGLNANSWVAPSVAPPAWVFGPVWTLLYLMIATSGYRIIRAERSDLKDVAFGLWGRQMCLNTLWTPVFFGAFHLQGSLIVIIALWLTIGAYCGVSLFIDRRASYLFLPYWAWVTFATILNYSYMVLNPMALGAPA